MNLRGNNTRIAQASLVAIAVALTTAAAVLPDEYRGIADPLFLSAALGVLGCVQSYCVVRIDRRWSVFVYALNGALVSGCFICMAGIDDPVHVRALLAALAVLLAFLLVSSLLAKRGAPVKAGDGLRVALFAHHAACLLCSLVLFVRMLVAYRSGSFLHWSMFALASFAKNGNPKPDLVQGYYKLFKGDNADIFSLLGASRLSAVFEGDAGKTRRLVSNVKRSCARGAATFPYKMTSHYFDAAGPSAPSGMFEPFLDDLLRRRHDIVHGNTLANGLGVNALDDYITKAQLLVYGYVLAICQGVLGAAG